VVTDLQPSNAPLPTSMHDKKNLQYSKNNIIAGIYLQT